MNAKGRITLTHTQAASSYGQRLIHQIMAISSDGDLTIDEVRALHEVLRGGPPEIAAVPFLRAITTGILSDGRIDPAEAYELRRGMERVVPKQVRANLTMLLSSIGLPSVYDDDERRSWHDDPMTAKQRDFIRNLGGSVPDHMTKGEASALIDTLLDRRAPSPRQMMVLRFFDRLDLATRTKEEVSVWLDDLYARHEQYERAWDRFKIETGDDGTRRDPMLVPIGAFQNYTKVRARALHIGNKTASGTVLATFCAVAFLVLLLYFLVIR